jgi:hypothetical protein
MLRAVLAPQLPYPFASGLESSRRLYAVPLHTPAVSGKQSRESRAEDHYNRFAR